MAGVPVMSLSDAPSKEVWRTRCEEDDQEFDLVVVEAPTGDRVGTWK
jgi:hypothetical protein